MQVTTTTYAPLPVSNSQQAIPQAIPVSDSNTITIDQDKLTEHLAQSQKEILNVKQKYEEKELKRLIDARIQFEKFESEERIRVQKQQADVFKRQQEIEWRIQNPAAAEENDRIAREQANIDNIKKNAESQRKVDEQNALAKNKLALEEMNVRAFKTNTKCAGYTFIGIGAGLLYFSNL